MWVWKKIWVSKKSKKVKRYTALGGVSLSSAVIRKMKKDKLI